MKNGFVALNYVDLVSNACLKIIDNFECAKSDRSGLLFLDLRPRDKREALTAFLKDGIRDGSTLGYKTVVYGTCDVEKNWRVALGNAGDNFSKKYSISDSSVFADESLLRIIFDTEFAKLRREQRDVAFVEHTEVDSIDMRFILKKLLGMDCKMTNTDAYIIRDGNDCYSRVEDVRSYLVCDLEIELMKTKVL